MQEVALTSSVERESCDGKWDRAMEEMKVGQRERNEGDGKDSGGKKWRLNRGQKKREVNGRKDSLYRKENPLKVGRKTSYGGKRKPFYEGKKALNGCC